MFNGIEINPSFFAALLEAGWIESRNIYISTWITALGGEQYEPSSTAVSILKSFGTLKVKLPKSSVQPYDQTLWFEPVEAAGGLYLSAKYFEDQLGIRLFPLGSIDIDTVIWVGSDEKFYIGLLYGLYLLGGQLSRIR